MEIFYNKNLPSIAGVKRKLKKSGVFEGTIYTCSSERIYSRDIPEVGKGKAKNMKESNVLVRKILKWLTCFNFF